jgi:hypothetical protein
MTCRCTPTWPPSGTTSATSRQDELAKVYAMTIQADESLQAWGARVMAQVQLVNRAAAAGRVKQRVTPSNRCRYSWMPWRRTAGSLASWRRSCRSSGQLDADKRTVPVLMGRLQKALDSRIDARMESTPEAGSWRASPSVGRPAPRAGRQQRRRWPPRWRMARRSGCPGRGQEGVAGWPQHDGPVRRRTKPWSCCWRRRG